MRCHRQSLAPTVWKFLSLFEVMNPTFNRFCDVVRMTPRIDLLYILPSPPELSHHTMCHAFFSTNIKYIIQHGLTRMPTTLSSTNRPYNLRIIDCQAYQLPTSRFLHFRAHTTSQYVECPPNSQPPWPLRLEGPATRKSYHTKVPQKGLCRTRSRTCVMYPLAKMIVRWTNPQKTTF